MLEHNILHDIVSTPMAPTPATLYQRIARFLRDAAPMKLVPIALCLLLVGCRVREAPDAAEENAAEVPIGPGTDSTALTPPDTPISSVRDARVPDTTRNRNR